MEVNPFVSTGISCWLGCMSMRRSPKNGYWKTETFVNRRIGSPSDQLAGSWWQVCRKSNAFASSPVLSAQYTTVNIEINNCASHNARTLE
eukprot:1194837-Prorocentrum_minimum.AAC.12